MARVHPDIVVLSEVDLSEPEALAVSIPGYETYLCAPNPDKKTRVIVLVSLNIVVRSVMVQPGLPVVVLDLGRYQIVGLYRQFSSAGTSGLTFERDQLDGLISFIEESVSEKPIFLLGDTNLDISKLDLTEYKRRPLLLRWLDLVKRLGSTWLPTPPTWTSYGLHNGDHRRSTIDRVYVPYPDGSTVVVLPDAATDHHPVLATARINKPPPMSGRLPRRTQRNFASVDYTALEQDLQFCAAWPTPSPKCPPSAILEDITAAINPSIDFHAPLKTFIIRKDTPELRLAPDTLRMMSMRDLARAKGPRGQFRVLRNKANRLMKRDKIQTAMKDITQAKCRSSMAWDICKRYLQSHRSLPLLQDCNTDHESAELCNKYFIDKVDQLRKSIARTAVSPTNNSTSSPDGRLSFSLHEVGYATIRRAIRAMGSSKAIGTDQIPVAFWKGTSKALLRPLTFLVNSSIRHGLVPKALKEAIIHPVFKGGGKDPKDPASYRPVAVLPALSKILERVIYWQLEAHLEENNLLPPAQHGFRQGRSTVTALQDAFHKWSTDRCKPTIASFDFSAAFDTVDQETIQNCLRTIGASHTTLKWFSSYLEDSHQAVKWGEDLSKFLPIKFGVRQGSILGPLLFVLLSSPVSAALGNPSWFYADDSTTSRHDVISLQNAASSLIKTSAHLGLVINTTKTQILHMGTNVGPVQVGPSAVQPSNTMTLLGLEFDRHLSTTPYLESLHTCLAQRLGMVRRLRSVLPRDVLRMVGMGLFFGKLQTYAHICIKVRLTATSSPSVRAKALQTLINDLARAVTGLRRKDKVPIESLLEKARIPALNHLVATASGMLAWNMSQPGHPLHHIFLEANLSSTTRASTAGKLRIPDSQALGIVNGFRVWNQCSELRSATTRNQAKNILLKFSQSLPV